MSAVERTGWRDQDISDRHRKWGFNCPAVDLDFLMIEYHLGLPVAVVEYKHYLNHEGDKINFKHPTYRALGSLADATTGETLPFLVVRYWPDTWAVRVRAVNEKAKKHLPRNEWVDMTERQYVTGIYRMRNLVAEEAVLRHLHEQMPPKVAA